MIGYLIEQELGNLLPVETPLATILTMVEVDPDDPAFADPTKFVGPVYDEAEAERWPPRRAGRSSPTATTGAASSPSPRPSGSSRSGRSAGCSSTARSSSAPAAAASRRCTRRATSATLVGVEAVIDKDLASELLAARARRRPVRDGDRRRRRLRRLGARREQRRLDRVTPDELAAHDFAGRIDGPEGGGRRRVRRARPASAPRSARWTRSRSSWTAAAGTKVVRRRRRLNGEVR